MTTTPVPDRLAERTLADVPVSAIRPNAGQPRRNFKGIDELAASIRDSGLLQPITVRPNDDGTYVIIAGERRFRAVTRLGWATIPAIVVDRDEADAYRLSVLENMARSDMTPVEEAKALAQLLQTMTAGEAAAAVGYGSTDGNQVTWKVKLLDAIEDVQELVNKGHINQTKAIQASKLSRDGQLKVLRCAGSQRLTDREWGALCDAIYSQENQTDMFPETKLSPEVVAERHELTDVVALLAKAAQRASALRIDVIMRGNRQAAVQIDGQLEEVIRALSRVKLTIQSEAGIALALGEESPR